MPYFEFIWDGENDDHLDEHGVTIEEFVEVVTNPERLESSRTSGRRRRRLATGRSRRGASGRRGLIVLCDHALGML